MLCAGTLNIYMKENNQLGSPVWSIASDHRDAWRIAMVPMKPNSASFSVSYILNALCTQFVIEQQAFQSHVYPHTLSVCRFCYSLCNLDLQPFQVLKIFFYCYKTYYRIIVTVLQLSFLIVQCFFQAVFEGVISPNPSRIGTLAIDDVWIDSSPCPPPGSCTFERNMCTLYNDRTNATMEWLRNNGETSSYYTGPTVDHTLGTNQGRASFICLTLKRGILSLGTFY